MWTISLEGGPRRVNHAAVAIGDKIYSFGGYCSGETMDPDCPIDIHVLNTNTYRWKYVKLANHSYSRISLEEDSDTDVEMDTGEDEDADDDRIVLDRVGFGNGKQPDEFPYQRYGHTVCTYKGKAYVWGGRNDESGASNTLHEFDPDTITWRIVPASGRIPPARDGHSAVVVGSKMYVFGGFEEDAQIFSQETFVFDFLTNHWTMMYTKGSPPIWRDFHTAVALDEKMYVFGGRSDQMGQFHSTRDVYCDRLKALDLKTGEWFDPEIKGSVKPTGRRSHSAWTYGGRMYIFGGYLGSLNKHYNDLFAYDPVTCCWQKIEASGLVEAPCPRRRQCTVVVKDRVFLFGGTMPVNMSGAANGMGLADLADLHVLDYAPSLLRLSACSVLHNGLHRQFAYALPKDIRDELHFMTKANEITNPPLQRHEVAG